jgi:hypothetical protein
MDDKFLYGLREDPRPEFGHDLHRRLLDAPSAPADATRARRRIVGAPLLWAAGAAAAVIALVVSPSLRASAQGFLDLFRVHTFAAVSVDAARIEQLKSFDVDPRTLLGTPRLVLDPGPPRAFTDPAGAQAAAGFALHMPTDVPWAMRPDTLRVHGAAQEDVHVDTSRLRSLLAALAIDDVTVPTGLDGADVSVHVSPIVGATYHHEGAEVVFVQGPSPEMTLPKGVDLSRLGAIGLRIAGLSHEDAQRFAQSVDWHSTLLVPIPATASSYREVEVRGQKGLLVTMGDTPTGPVRGRWHHAGSQLMWAEGGRVYALISSSVNDVDLLRMANSVQ